MKYLNKIASVFFIAALGVMTLTSCEGSDLYKVNAPDWLSEMGGDEEESSVVEITPNPSKLGNADNSTPWWSVFTDDIKAEPGQTYQMKFTNYGGSANWNNFVFILRNETKDVEYGVFRADNWCWSTKYPDGAASDNFCAKKMESDSRDWATWLKAMNVAKCTLTLTNYGDGTADIKCTMLGSDGVTYTQEYNTIEVDKDNLYFAFTVDGSHIEFGDINIEDSEPASMEVTGVPSEVVVGTEFNEAMANVTATVTYESGLTKTVAFDELQFETIPNYEELGQKTLVIIYNKTYLGANCSKPLVVSKSFSVVKELSAFTQTVVVPSPLTIGAEDNSDGFWGAHTLNVKVEPKETKVVHFTNYSDCATNWDNFLVVLCKESNAEYAVLRADNFGWGDGYAACAPSFEEGRDWDAWQLAMDGARVTAYVTNNGDGTADVKAVMTGNDGKVYIQEYKGINTVNPDDMYFRFTIEHAHLVFDQMVGATDFSTGFWGAHSQNVQVKPHTVATVNFTNYSNCEANFKNFLVVLNDQTTTKEYAVVRADNFGWGEGYGTCALAIEEGRDWDAWRLAMNGAKVTAQIVNNGDGTADIKAVMKGNDGNTYTQDYIGISVNQDDLYFRFTVENAYLVFE